MTAAPITRNRRLGEHVDDVIESALALVTAPIDVSDVDEAQVDEAWEEAMAARLDAYIADRDDALRRLRHVRLSVLAARDRYVAELDRLRAKIGRFEKIVSYCDFRGLDLLKLERDLNGGTEGERYKIELPESYAAIRVTRSSAVVIDDEEELPRSLVRVRVEPDKRAIKARLKAGQPVSGASLEERTTESMEWGR